MNRSLALVPRLVRLAAPLVLAGSLAAQTTPPPPATPTAPAIPPPVVTTTPVPPKVAPPKAPVLELPRLRSSGKAGEVPRLAKTKVTVDDLLPQGLAGAKTVTKQNFNYLALDAGREWSRPLRGGARDTAFVSFLAYGSVGTVIEIAGAQITVKASSKPGYAQLGVGLPANYAGPAPAFGNLVKIEKHDGADLVALPVFTVRLDPAAGVWDLYQFQRLVAVDIPLAEAKGARQFAVQPGAQGAWILSLVTADENPLYLDANANGIDDAFEKSTRNGVLLAANAPAAERRQLAQQWQASQRVADVPPWKIRRPVPDAVVALTPRPKS